MSEFSPPPHGLATTGRWELQPTVTKAQLSAPDALATNDGLLITILVVLPSAEQGHSRIPTGLPQRASIVRNEASNVRY